MWCGLRGLLRCSADGAPSLRVFTHELVTQNLPSTTLVDRSGHVVAFVSFASARVRVLPWYKSSKLAGRDAIRSCVVFVDHTVFGRAKPAVGGC